MAPSLAANVTDTCGTAFDIESIKGSSHVRNLIRYRVHQGQLRVDTRGSNAASTIGRNRREDVIGARVGEGPQSNPN
jgi:hypothetical protein